MPFFYVSILSQAIIKCNTHILGIIDSMNIIEVNRPAISQPHSISRGDVALWTREYMTESRVIATGSAEKPVYRLTKDYENDGLKFNLSMLIKSSNIGKAEKWLEKLAETITNETYQQYKQSKQAFYYLEERYKA